MNVIVIGKLGKDNLQSAITDYQDPSYRLELVLDRGTMPALSGPLKDLDNNRKGKRPESDKDMVHRKIRIDQHGPLRLAPQATLYPDHLRRGLVRPKSTASP